MRSAVGMPNSMIIICSDFLCYAASQLTATCFYCFQLNEYGIAGFCKINNLPCHLKL